jgi:hypothetical protein
MENSFNPSPNAGERNYNIGALDIDSTSTVIIVDLRNRGHKVNIASALISDPLRENSALH